MLPRKPTKYRIMKYNSGIKFVFLTNVKNAYSFSQYFIPEYIVACVVTSRVMRFLVRCFATHFLFT